MSKKDEKVEEKQPDPNVEEIKEKVEAKVEKVEKKIEKKTGSRENLIGDLADPKIDDDFNFKDWAKKLDEKLDLVLASKKEEKVEEVPVSEPPPKNVRWYDRELF